MDRLCTSTTTTYNTYRGETTVSSVVDNGVAIGVESRSMLVRNPVSGGWRSPSAYFRNGIAPRYWTITRWEQTEVTFFTSKTVRSGTLVGSVYGFSPAGTPQHVQQSVIDRAMLECLLKIKDEKYNAALMIAEAGKSVDLIADSLVRLYRGYSAARRGKWGEVPRALGCPPLRKRSRAKETGSRWLEYQYGWLPLMSDVYGAIESVQNGLAREPRISASRTIRQPIFSPPPSEVWNSGRTWTISHQVEGFKLVKVRLDFKVDGAIADFTRVGLTNPLAIAWELVPFSFLLDWVLPIGDYLSALDATTGLTFIGGTQTLFYKQSGKSKAVTSSGSPSFSYQFELDSSFDDFDVQRSVIQSVRVPLPSFKSPVSIAHAANALALFSVIKR